MKTAYKSIITVVLMGLLLSLMSISPAKPVLAQDDFTVTVGQDKVFTELNYANSWTQILCYYGDYWCSGSPPSTAEAIAAGNHARTSVLATIGWAPEAQADIGTIFNWNIGQHTWEEVKNWPVSVTVSFSYSVEAFWWEARGYAASGIVVKIGEKEIGIYKPGPGGPGSDSGTTSLTYASTIQELEQLERKVMFHLYSGAVSCLSQTVEPRASAEVNVSSIKIEFTNGNPPVANNDAYSTNEDTALTAPAPGVLGNDSDVDGDTLTAILVNGPSHGTLTLNADGSFAYTPDANYNGPDSFTYKANDGKADSNIAAVIITVTEENQPPIASFKSWNIEDIGTDQPTRIEGHHMVGGQIEFNARESSDPAGGTLTYYWNFGDGTQETTLNPVILKVYTKPEKFTVTLSVKNDKGISSTNTASEELDLSLNPGDLLVIRSGWPYAEIFDFFGLTYTHVGMYVGKIDGEYRVVESTFSSPPLSQKIGVQETPIERWGYPHETYVDVVRVTNDPEIAARAVAFARGMALADPPHGYDTWLSGKQIDCSGKDDINIPKGYSPLCFSYYCSELVWAAYYRASDGAIDLSDHAKRPLQVAVSPDDIFNHPLSTNVGWHHEKYPPKNVGVLSISVLSPVDISVTDPSGLTITKESSQIPDAAYVETDLDENNDIDDVVIIPEPKLGDYLILVIPEPGASPTDTYTLEVLLGDGTTIVLAKNVPISDIPSQPYVFESAGIAPPILNATVRVEPETLNLASQGMFTAFIALPEGYDVADIDVSTVVCEGAPAMNGTVSGKDKGIYIAIAKFNRQDLVNMPTGDVVTLRVTGKVYYSGILIDFEGSDIIRVIYQGKGKK